MRFLAVGFCIFLWSLGFYTYLAGSYGATFPFVFTVALLWLGPRAWRGDLRGALADRIASRKMRLGLVGFVALGFGLSGLHRLTEGTQASDGGLVLLLAVAAFAGWIARSSLKTQPATSSE